MHAQARFWTVHAYPEPYLGHVYRGKTFLEEQDGHTVLSRSRAEHQDLFLPKPSEASIGEASATRAVRQADNSSVVWRRSLWTVRFCTASVPRLCGDCCAVLDCTATVRRPCGDRATTLWRLCGDCVDHCAATLQRLCRDRAKTVLRPCCDRAENVRRPYRDRAATMENVTCLPVPQDVLNALLDQTYARQMLPVIVYLLVLCPVGALGNLLVIVVNGARRNKSSSTCFILALAGADFLISAAVVPMKVFSYYHITYTSTAWCKINPYLTTASVLSSTFLLIAIAADRFYAVYWPVQYLAVRKGRVLAAIAGTLLLGGVVAIPVVLDYQVVGGIRVGPACTSVSQCYVTDSTNVTVLFIVTAVLFFLSVLIMAVLYALDPPATSTSDIALRDVRGRAHASRGGRKNRHGNSQQQLLLLVTLVFVLSWLPFWVLSLYEVAHPGYLAGKPTALVQAVALINDLYFVNNAANPIIYTFVQKSFRQRVLVGLAVLRGYTQDTIAWWQSVVIMKCLPVRLGGRLVTVHGTLFGLFHVRKCEEEKKAYIRPHQTSQDGGRYRLPDTNRPQPSVVKNLLGRLVVVRASSTNTFYDICSFTAPIKSLFVVTGQQAGFWVGSLELSGFSCFILTSSFTTSTSA
ncbi:hypothetical protein Bbelb_202970 [Branchiostoma belcheri]|nr:hypothetical protein Bbelb_202970 [Branchiostoma belcheri]